MCLVADTGPLLALGMIDRLDLLPRLFSAVYIPTEVRRELERGASKYRDAQNALRSVLEGLLVEVPVEAGLMGEVERLMMGPPKLGRAQAEAIVLCRQLGITLLLVDDLDAVKVAHRLGIKVIHGLDILVRSVEAGLLSSSEALSYIERFRRAGEYCEKDLRRAEKRLKRKEGRWHSEDWNKDFYERFKEP